MPRVRKWVLRKYRSVCGTLVMFDLTWNWDGFQTESCLRFELDNVARPSTENSLWPQNLAIWTEWVVWSKICSVLKMSNFAGWKNIHCPDLSSMLSYNETLNCCCVLFLSCILNIPFQFWMISDDIQWSDHQAFLMQVFPLKWSR